MSRFSFSQVPTISRRRSVFDLSFSHKTSMNVGDLVPWYVQEVSPGDTFKVDATFVARTPVPFIKPVMDNLFCDTWFFFVPNRLVWDGWESLMGENKGGYWAESDPALVPQCVSSDQNPPSDSDICMYMGVLPTLMTKSNVSISDLPFRAFALIWNEWFRDQNTQAPVNVDLSDNNATISLGNAWSPTNYHGRVPKVNKVHDYFTSCLPSPQKGDAIELPLTGDAVVKTASNPLLTGNDVGHPLKWGLAGGGSTTLPAGNYNLALGTSGGNYLNGILESSWFSANTATTSGGSAGVLFPSNLYADLSNVTSATVNDLRMAFALQRMLEQDARGGTRYIEILQSHFGVRSPDARLQRPEYLGGSRSPISIQQVTQTTGSDSTSSPLASVGAFSLSSGNCKFTKGFVEHGFVIGISAIRYYHTYQQGLERFWTRKNRTDFYMPTFANIGEQPVYQSELFSSAYNPQDNPIFGYNEAWADYRYRPNRISGQLNTYGSAGTGTEPLDIWHFGDTYSNAPVLNSSFIQENNIPINRCLSVPSGTVQNFIFDFYVKNEAIRVMPTYSFPGLIDHH